MINATTKGLNKSFFPNHKTFKIIKITGNLNKKSSAYIYNAKLGILISRLDYLINLKHKITKILVIVL